jgi:hypothetical protein
LSRFIDFVMFTLWSHFMFCGSARGILDILRTSGTPLTRHQIYEATKDFIPSKTQCKRILRQLAIKHRIKVKSSWIQKNNFKVEKC